LNAPPVNGAPLSVIASAGAVLSIVTGTPVVVTKPALSVAVTLTTYRPSRLL